MSPEQAVALTEFARACKAAARSVSLYPATHPAIQNSLSRVTGSAARLIPGSELTLTVQPDTIVIDGRAAVRPDPAIGELAELLHGRLIGALTIARAADPQDWHAILLLLSRASEDLIAEGGIGNAWTATGRGNFAIREIDYAEVLRERAGSGGGAEWDTIIAHCLQGGAAALDERALSTLLDTLGHPARFGALLDRLQDDSVAGGATVGARVAALLQIVRRLRDMAMQRGGDEAAAAALQTVADATSRLTPEMLLAIVQQARSGDSEEARVAAGIVDRMGDETVASFVAGSVVSERGATERLAQAFEALVPELERKERMLDLAKNEVARSSLGKEDGFDQLWEATANMLTSYSDKNYVSAEYGRELSGARMQAIDVERVSDDPPERVEAWLASVSDGAVKSLDLSLLLDLLRIENDPHEWGAIALVVMGEIERRTLLGDVPAAQQLLEGVIREFGEQGRPGLKPSAESALDGLATGPLPRHVVVQLRKADDSAVEPLNRLVHTIGPRVVRAFAEALATEDNSRTIGRLREILIGFGAAGRASVERLKNSSNPAVRRAAIDLLRIFGGDEALPELALMLDDADPQVQRESIRAIVQIGTNAAYAVLEKALVAKTATRDTIVQQLIGLRDDKAVPLLCYVLNHSAPRGKLVEVHAQIIEALGGLSAHSESTRTLRTILFRSEWWAPFRTAALRQASAIALRRIGSPETIAVLEEATRTGGRGVKGAAQAQIDLAARRERQRA